ncbi:hypothetical protein CMEL01_02030 [Colletotrichum melonis]|uniref:Uncharacterized protein n=1 Tax=Colletotrichum melonis TaxID=1209925 RepID=A0AAI9UL02_9PEZI|nr:hypothetical protein CMEL01_02030 [Colletotrichum melonis]
MGTFPSHHATPEHNLNHPPRYPASWISGTLIYLVAAAFSFANRLKDHGYLLPSLHSILLATRTQAFRCRSIGWPALGRNCRSWQQLCNTLSTLY